MFQAGVLQVFAERGESTSKCPDDAGVQISKESRTAKARAERSARFDKASKVSKILLGLIPRDLGTLGYRAGEDRLCPCGLIRAQYGGQKAFPFQREGR